MRNNFIKILLNKRNEFRTSMNISIPSINVDMLDDVDVKIDTGCPYTSIPIKKLGISDQRAQLLKQIDADNIDIEKKISFGVNDSESKKINDIILFDNHKYMDITSVTFKHTDVKIKISGFDTHINSVRLSYDRSGNILIGMDILKEWDIHIGTITTGETIFLACPRNQLNSDYYQELNRLFLIS
jgi:hypothetical protein